MLRTLRRVGDTMKLGLLSFSFRSFSARWRFRRSPSDMSSHALVPCSIFPSCKGRTAVHRHAPRRPHGLRLSHQAKTVA